MVPLELLRLLESVPPPATEARGAPPASPSESLGAGAAKVVKQAAVGLVAAGSGAAAVYPIDVAKTRMQVQGQQGGHAGDEGDAPCRWEGEMLVRIFQREGLAGLYAGLAAQVMGAAPEKTTKVLAFTYARGLLLQSGALAGVPLDFVAGAIGGLSQVVVTNPLETVKITMQLEGLQRGPGHSPGHDPGHDLGHGSGHGLGAGGAEGAVLRGPQPARAGLVSIVRELGFGGLYRGVGVTFTRDAISAALFFATYGWAKLWLEAHGLDEGFLQKLLAGLAAGVPAAYFVTPIDVVKTRLQSGEPGLGAADVLRTTLREEGVGALMAGALGRVSRISPQLAITLALFEVLEKWV